MTKKHFLFETKRLYVRLLKDADLPEFHIMQSDPRVMKYVQSSLLDLAGNKADLTQLIDRYQDRDNDFFIYAICFRNSDQFIGSIALVKDDNGEDEIGYRFIPTYWGQGYGFEIVEGLIAYCKLIKKKSIVAYIAEENKASHKIIQKLGFSFLKKVKSDLNLVELKYIIDL